MDQCNSGQQGINKGFETWLRRPIAILKLCGTPINKDQC